MIAELLAQLATDNNSVIANGISYVGMSGVIVYLAKLAESLRKEIAELNKSYTEDYIKLLVQDIETVNKNSFMIENSPLNTKHQIHEELEVFKKELIEILKQHNS